MKGFAIITIALFAAISAVEGAPQRGRGGQGSGRNRNGAVANIAVTSAAAVSTATPVATGNTAVVGAMGGAVTRGASTIVMFEVGGIPGNECLTFRNNGISPLVI